MPKVGFGPNVGLDQTDLQGREKANACQVWWVGPMPLRLSTVWTGKRGEGDTLAFPLSPSQRAGRGVFQVVSIS